MTFLERPIGIDLGTTNSEVAMLEPSERELFVYQDRFKRRTLPSAVVWDAKSEKFLVGRQARNRRGREPAPIESIKRKMGSDAKVRCGPHELSPEEVSGKILAELAARMRDYLSERAQDGVEMRVQRAVITVPAYFDAPQVEATRRAAQLADIDPIGILQEPTAAAIYHTFKRNLGDGNFLIYDFGGGTFDVSILRCISGEYQVLAIDGDNVLGGDDLDRRFAEHLRQLLVERGYALDLDVRHNSEDRERFGRLVHLAQEVKEALSTREVVHLTKTDVVEDQDGEQVELEAEIGRDEYEAVVGELVETTIRCCLQALEQSQETAGVGLKDIDNVILVGGSTRVPLVIRRVSEALCEPSQAQEPLQDQVDTCVALGAAIHAAQLGGLRIGNDEASVLITSPLLSNNTPLKLTLSIEKSPQACKRLAVTRDGNAIARAPYSGGTEPLQLAIPLEDTPEQALSLQLQDADEALLTELPFAAYRGDVRPRASSLSRPAVVAKDIALEVVRAGRRERSVLMPRGTGLPMKVSQTFFTADQSGAVVLRLLQGRMPIKTLVLQVPGELPVGSAVELTIRCDEAMRMEARADVAGHELWATVEAASAPKFDPRGDVEGLLEQAEDVRRSLWGSRGEYFARESRMLSAAIREVVATDPDKLAILCARLQLLVAEFEPDETAGGLAPPMHHFEWELDSLRRTVYRASGSLMGISREGWEARISDIEQRAEEAYREANAVAWRRVFNEVQALAETAHQEEFSAMRLDDPAYVARWLTTLQRRAGNLRSTLLDFVPATSEDVRALQLRERERLLTIAQNKIVAKIDSLEVTPENANDVRRTLRAVDAQIDRLDIAVERLPTIGVVAEHGGGGSRRGGP